jgi:hypothetical protein
MTSRGVPMPVVRGWRRSTAPPRHGLGGREHDVAGEDGVQAVEGGGYLDGAVFLCRAIPSVATDSPGNPPVMAARVIRSLCTA